MANSSREKIVIPVFNLFVKDIYFLHKIHTNHLPNGHINFKVSSAQLWPKGTGTRAGKRRQQKYRWKRRPFWPRAEGRTEAGEVQGHLGCPVLTSHR